MKSITSGFLFVVAAFCLFMTFWSHVTQKSALKYLRERAKPACFALAEAVDWAKLKKASAELGIEPPEGESDVSLVNWIAAAQARDVEAMFSYQIWPWIIAAACSGAAAVSCLRPSRFTGGTVRHLPE